MILVSEGGGTGRRAGLRIQWATVGVRLPPFAPFFLPSPLFSNLAILPLASTWWFISCQRKKTFLRRSKTLSKKNYLFRCSMMDIQCVQCSFFFSTFLYALYPVGFRAIKMEIPILSN